MYERHSLLSNWLMNLGVPEDIALEDACRIEHVISEESFSRIREHAEIMAERLKNIE
jgi:Mn-dependent DtxR family transcriptional regulator